MWFAGKRVALARRFKELGGGENPSAGMTGTIHEMIEPHLYHVHGRHGVVWAICNCIVRWDADPGNSYQHTSQLEPIIHDDQAGDMSLEQLLDIGNEELATV